MPTLYHTSSKNSKGTTVVTASRYETQSPTSSGEMGGCREMGLRDILGTDSLVAYGE